MFFSYNLNGDDSMYTIKKEISNELIVKGSKFICVLYHIEDVDDVDNHLDYLRKKYKDATHICYAYRLENNEKFSDDGEPSGTAGFPMMSLLKKKDINNTLAVVIRYFGGTKLGAGGLIRTYQKSISETLINAELVQMNLFNYYDLVASYDDLKLLNSLTIDYDIIGKAFNRNIIYKIKVEQNKDDVEKVFQTTNIKVKKLNN